MKKIYLDCDGTWIDLYGVNGWLDDILNENPRPYIEAKPLVNLAYMARLIHRLQANGYEVNIISWLAKNASDEYNELVRQAKLNWFKRHLPSVEFNEIHIVAYGEPKSHYGYGYLFDDEEPNRREWKGIAYSEKDLLNKLLGILKNNA